MEFPCIFKHFLIIISQPTTNTEHADRKFLINQIRQDKYTCSTAINQSSFSCQSLDKGSSMCIL
jgi:hypothetical protein